MVVKSNLSAMNSNRMLNATNYIFQKSTEKLSSGYRVNRAADDAAGLAISEKMRRQIRGLTMASRNSQDGISFCQIADGALNEVHDMLKRAEELSVQAANGTNSEEDRAALDLEIQQLSHEIDHVHESAVFNELRVFTDAGIVPGVGKLSEYDNLAGGDLHVNVNGIDVTFSFVDSTGNKISAPDATQVSGTANSSSVANSDLAQFAVKAAADAVYNLSQNFPNLFNAASTSGIQIGLELKDQSVGMTLATAGLSMSASTTSSVMSYKMWIDTKDYPIDSFSTMPDAKKADLAAVISHEMTHLVMYDTVTDGMFGAFPDWFVEGMAQTTSGDNGWLSGSINPSSSDTNLKDYKAQAQTMPYGAGYAACMYLGYVAGSGKLKPDSASEVTSATIRTGLDKVLTALAGKKSLDEAIKEATDNKFANTQDFINHFTSASDPNSLAFMREFVNARGTTGAGSLSGELNESEASLFAPSSLTGTYGSYVINPDNTWYSNAYGTGYTFPQNLPSTGGGGSGQGNDKAGLILQVGTEKGHEMYIHQFNASAMALFANQKMDVTTEASARATMDLVKDADSRVSTIRSYYGAVQNRLEHKIRNLDNTVENTTAAESQIRDTDMASEMVAYSNRQILINAGQSMLAQANKNQEQVLSLLS